MGLVEILVAVLSTVGTGVAVWLLQRLAKLLGIKKNSELITVLDKYAKKAIAKYSDELGDLVKKGGKDLSKENEVVGKMVTWFNKNAPKLVNDFFGMNTEQLEEYIRTHVREYLNEKVG